MQIKRIDRAQAPLQFSDRNHIIVVGASAGGVKALQQLVRGFPRDFSAAVLVVLHSSPDGPALLGEILNITGPLPSHNAIDGEPIEPGRIYVAPPDHHLLCAGHHIQLWQGPKENLHRPCINVTFRSTADEYGENVIGAVLTGTLDDGTAGLWWIRKHGGTIIVQNPTDAQYSEMPTNVLKHMQPDHSVNIADMGSLIAGLIRERRTNGRSIQGVNGMQKEEPILVTCPDCNGPLREVRLGDSIREYRCLVGHAYSPVFLLKGHDEAEEKALWAAAASLEEAAPLVRKVGESLSQEDRLKIEEDAAEKLRLSAELHQFILRLRKFRLPAA